uniref:Uncharacterized protein n=1 Tax=Trichuris muris TaxID=70415 RepID=A0A5S6QE75_TRIMR
MGIYVWVTLFYSTLLFVSPSSLERSHNAEKTLALTTVGSREQEILTSDKLETNETSATGAEEQPANATSEQSSGHQYVSILSPNEKGTVPDKPIKSAHEKINILEPDTVLFGEVDRRAFTNQAPRPNFTKQSTERLNASLAADDPVTLTNDATISLDKMQSNLIILSCVLSVGVMLSLYRLMKVRKRRNAVLKRRNSASPSPARDCRKGSKVWNYPGPPSFKEVVNVPSGSQVEACDLSTLATEVIHEELLKENAQSAVASPQTKRTSKKKKQNPQ